METINKIEAILLLGGDEIKIKEISKYFNISLDKTLELLEELKERRKDTGINIELNGEIVNLVTNAKYGEDVSNFFEQEAKPKKLSSAALETLSIVAYRQPVTKPEIESIRGVSVDRIVQNMEDKKFIRICGRKETIGRPNLYEITDKFLAYLGIESVVELTNYNKIKGSIENDRNED